MGWKARLVVVMPTTLVTPVVVSLVFCWMLSSLVSSLLLLLSSRVSGFLMASLVFSLFSALTGIAGLLCAYTSPRDYHPYARGYIARRGYSYRT
jgi:hypothetical protein